MHFWPWREVFNGLRYIVRTGAQWRVTPNDLPPWHTIYQQTRRWLKAGVVRACGPQLAHADP